LALSLTTSQWGQTKGHVLLRKAQYRLADDQTWSLHLAQLMVAADDFLYQGEKGVVLTDKGRRMFLTAWQNRMPYVQAMLLARYLRNDIDDYLEKNAE
jgi:hypothetical protein